MSARAGEWHLLGHDRDPVTGDPAEVERLAAGYRSTAADIERLGGQLRRLSELSGWKGEAAETFAESAEDLADDLRDAEQRYERLASAVQGWVAPLTTARDESAGALRDAVTADDAVRRHSSDLLAGVPDPTPEQAAAQRAQTAAHDAAAADLQRARSRLSSAMAALEDAAGRTAAAIREAAEHGRDSWWDNAKGTVRDWAGVLKGIATVLSYVGMALAAITLVVVLVATGPAALLTALLVGGMVLSGASALVHTALVLSDSGDATWLDVGLDLLGLATAGVGAKLAGGLAKGVSAARGALGQELSASARSAQQAVEEGAANFTRAGNASSIADAGNPLRQWGEQYLEGAASRVTQAGDDAVEQLEAGVVTDAPWANRLASLDRGVAEDLLEAQRLAGQPGLSPALADQLATLAGRSAALDGVAWTNAAGQLADSTDQVWSDLGGSGWKGPLDRSLQDLMWRLSN